MGVTIKMTFRYCTTSLELWTKSCGFHTYC